MAKGTEMAEVVPEATTVVGYEDNGYQWDTVHTEAPDQVEFDDLGDMLIGVYAGHEIVYPDPEKEPAKFFVQLRWTVPGGAVFVNAGHELRNAYTTTVYDPEGRPTITDKIPVGSMTRNELRKTVDTGKKDPMKSYRVDVARPVSAANPA
jgi:hypothetical protein